MMKLFLLLAVALTASAQYYPGPGRVGGRSGAAGGAGLGSVIDAVATVDGVFKTADKKFVEVQVESGDIMRLYITGKTKFIRDGKAVKSSEFHDGEKVTADATRDARLNMLAVKIELVKPDEKAKDEKAKEDKPDK